MRRSSTTNAIARRTCSGRSFLGGGIGVAVESLVLRGAGVGVEVAIDAGVDVVLTYEKFVMVLGLPLSNISKSSALRSRTCLPLLSVTVTSS